MPKASPIQYGFNGGQLGPRLQGRSDLARYGMGCNILTNFLPTYQGPAVKRSGFRHVKIVKDSTKKTRLIPFEFSREQAYVLELGEGYLRVYKDSGTVLESTVSITGVTAANPVVVTAANSYSAGDQVFITGSAQTELNGRYHTVANPTGANFELSGEDGTGRSTGSGGTAARVYEIEDGVSSNSLPWLEAELFEISFVQSADVLYLAHGNHPPHKISRTSDTAWTCAEIVFDWPAFREENLDDAQTMVISQNTGSSRTITATGAGNIFTASMVGSHVRIGHLLEADVPKWQAGVNFAGSIDPRFGTAAVGDQVYFDGKVYSIAAVPPAATGSDPPTHEAADGTVKDKSNSWDFYNRGAGYAKITAVAGAPAAACTVDVVVDFPYRVSTANPSKTSHGGTDFDAVSSPRWAIGAWNDDFGYPRAVAFYEDRLWFGGTSKDPQTFWGSRTGDYENFETVADEDDSALVFTLASDRINAIEWMTGEDVLLIGTKGGEFTADAGNAEQAITPSNVRVRRRSFYGSAESVSPITVDSATIFVQRSKERLHELIYTTDAGGYSRLTAPDLTQMSYDILASGVVQMAYQASPLRLLWCVLTDGTLASLTYVRDEDVLAWAKHTAGGTSAKVESVAVVPHPDGDQDQLWVITSRTVNGATSRHIEFMEKPFENDDIPDAFFVDAGLTYSGASTTTITGLNHLEGESVSILGDGLIQSAKTVTSGAITLDTAVTKAQVGLAMPEAQLQTMRIDAGGADGTAMGKKKRVHKLVIRLLEAGEGVRYGSNMDGLDEWSLRDPNDAMDTAVPLFTGDTPALTMPGHWEREGRVAVAHALPLPCTVVSLMPQLETGTR